MPPAVADLLSVGRAVASGSRVLIGRCWSNLGDCRGTRNSYGPRDRRGSPHRQNGMTAEGTEPGLTQLRLIANRDYESKPTSVRVRGRRWGEITGSRGSRRSAARCRDRSVLRNHVGGTELRGASNSPPSNFVERPVPVASRHRWLVRRSTGQPLSPAGRLLLLGPQSPPPLAARLLVVRFSTPELADGAMQWPETRGFIADRASAPLRFSVEENLDAPAESVGRHRDQNRGLVSIPLPFPPVSQQYPQTLLNHSGGCFRCPIASTVSRVRLP